MYMHECACTHECVSMSVHAFHVYACLCKFHVYAYGYIGMCMYAYVQVCTCKHVLCLCICIVHLSVYTQVRGWETPSQVSSSATQSKSPVKVRVTQSELRRGFGELGPTPYTGGEDSPAARACHPGLQETLIIDQQIPNVNRAIRPENTDIHHPDTNYAAGPDVITGVQLDA